MINTISIGHGSSTSRMSKRKITVDTCVKSTPLRRKHNSATSMLSVSWCVLFSPPYPPQRSRVWGWLLSLFQTQIEMYSLSMGISTISFPFKRKRWKKVLRYIANHWCVTGYFKLSFSFSQLQSLEGQQKKPPDSTKCMRLQKLTKLSHLKMNPLFLLLSAFVDCGYTNLSFRSR